MTDIEKTASALTSNEDEGVVAPLQAAEAAQRIHRDIDRAMEVLYGEIGGMDDTPDEIAAAEKVIADDMRTVLAYVLQQPAASTTLHVALAKGIDRGLRDMGATLSGCTPSMLTGWVIRELRASGLLPGPQDATEVAPSEASQE